MASSTHLQLQQLHAKLRALESTQRESDQEHARILAKQRQQVEELEAQNAQLRQLLGKGSKSASLADQERIDKLIDLVETYTRKVEVEGRQVEALHQEVELKQAKILEVQRSGSGDSVEAAKQVAKARLTLENRLEQAEKRFGDALTRNKSLRQDIDRLNKDKTAFHQLCAKIEREMATVHSELETVKASIATCEEAKTIAQKHLTALQLQADKEAAAAAQELQEMEECQAADIELMEIQARRLAAAAESLVHHTDGSDAPESLDAQACVDIIRTLQDVSGVRSLPALVSHLCQLEALNFELFNECNQANERIGSISKQIKALQLQAQQVEETSGSAQHKEVIRATIHKQEQTMKRAEMFLGKRQVLERRLALLRAGVGVALKALGAKLIPAQRPEDPECVFNTLLQNLGQLEARSRAVLAVHGTLAGRDTVDARAMLHTHLSSSTRQRTGGSAPPSRPASGTPERAAGAIESSGQPENAPVASSSGGQGRVVPGSGTRTGSSRPKRDQKGIDSDSTDSKDQDNSDSDSDADVVPLTRAELQQRIGYQQT